MPPSLNRYYRHVGAKVLISEDGRKYREMLARIIKRDRLLTGSIKADIFVERVDNRRRDLDNLCKCLLDSLTHAGVYMDDSQIDDLRIHRDGDINHNLNVILKA
jgi:crossover junction endodeoxyribonuclease RusA